MSGRNGETSSDDSGEEQPEDQPEDQDEEVQPVKKKKENIPREWMEVERWKLCDHSEEDIEVFVRKHLDDLNRSAGILYAIPGAHKNRNNKYGDFQFKRKWQTNKGAVMNYLVSCPLRCGCLCEAKISHKPEEIILFFRVHKAHTAQDHVSERDSGKFLKFQQKSLIAGAVKVAPLQTASEFLRNVQDSLTKKIDHKLKKSVARLVRKERAQIISVTLDGVTIDNSVGSLARLAEAIWFGDAVKQHQRGHQCIDLFKSYIIGKQIMDNDRTVFLTFSNVWDLLNFWRAVGTGYDVQLFGDVTGKASTAALNRLGFGVNRLGAHFAPLSFHLSPPNVSPARHMRRRTVR